MLAFCSFVWTLHYFLLFGLVDHFILLLVYRNFKKWAQKQRTSTTYKIKRINRARINLPDEKKCATHSANSQHYIINVNLNGCISLPCFNRLVHFRSVIDAFEWFYLGTVATPPHMEPRTHFFRPFAWRSFVSGHSSMLYFFLSP